MLRYIFTIVFCLCLVQSSAESQVSLTAQPGVIRDGLTNTLTLTCSLQDVSTSENPQASANSSTQFDVEHVNSIIVFRGSASAETPVARIIRSSNTAEALVDEENLQVTGDLDPARSTDHKFLELVWTTPRQQQGGQYTCEVYAVNRLGRGVVLTANADVKSEVPNIQELITEMIKLAQKTNAQEQTINELEQKTNAQEQTINELEQKTNAQEQTINELKEKSNTQEQTINGMKSVLKPPHAEQGVVTCILVPGGWRRMEGDPNTRSTSTSVQFQKPYVDVPVISAGVVQLDVHRDYNTRYIVDVTDISTTGFKIKCSTYADTVLYVLKVHWTSTVA